MSYTPTGAIGPVPGGPLVEVDAVLLPSSPPMPWAGRHTGQVATFRGRLNPGWARLPHSPLTGTAHGIAFGLASTAVILKSVGGNQPVPANAPWAVPSDGTWRIVFARTTDLRLIHANGVALNAPASTRRPIRFRGNCERALRAAISASTPVWVDDRYRPIANLASLPAAQAHASSPAIRPLSPSGDHDATTAFTMLAALSLEQYGRDPDPRVDRVVDHIDTHLADPALTTDTIAASCALSRRALQALFADQGGIANYLRRRRLEAALQILTTDAAQMPELDEVARATGLGSRRTLERAMRQVYGLTPRQARAELLAGYTLRQLETPEALHAS